MGGGGVGGRGSSALSKAMMDKANQSSDFFVLHNKQNKCLN